MARNNKRNGITTLTAALIAFCTMPAAADEALELDRLVVTAGLQPLAVGDVASSVTIISREEIEQRQVRYLSDLLRDVPGFAVSQAGGAGSQTQVRVRGAEANQVLVLMDGVRANDPAASDEFQYQIALTSDIERIEIIRGPQSATWGSDAMAGVINIIRRKGSGGQYLSGSIEGGSFNTLNAAANGGYSSDAFRINGGFSYLDSDGINISRTGSEKDGTRNKTGNLALEFDAGDAVSLRFSGQATDSSSDYDDIDYIVTGLPTDADRVTESKQTFLTGEAGFGSQQSPWSGKLSVHRMDSDNDNFSDGRWSSSTAAGTTEYRLRGGVVFGGSQSHRVSFAIEREEVDFSQRGEASIYGDPNQDQSYQVNGYALEYVGKPGSGFTWTVSARRDDFSDFDDASTWQAAASYRLSPGLRLRASLGTGVKAPTFTERYGYYEDFFIGNPDLKPESSRGWEAGIETGWSDNRHRLQVVYFDQDLEDEIDGFVFDPDSFLFTARNRETDSAREGLEVVLDSQFSKSLKLGASYTFTDAREVDAGGQSVREVRRPRHMAAVFASYYFSDQRGNLSLNLNYTGSQLDVFYSPVTYTSSLVKLDAYTVLDLAASYRLTSALEVTGRISNLLDEQYEEILGFVRPGRAVYAGLRGRFDF